MTRRSKAAQLAGETLRDVGILLMVFGPLDAFFQGDRRMAGTAVLLAAVGLFLIAGGIIIESRMEERR